MGENAARTLRYLNRRSDPRQRSNLGASTGRPRYKSKVAAFTPGEIAALLDAADAEAATLIRLAVTTGLRIGEPAGLQWRDVDLGKGTIEVRRQFSHGAWAELKTENAKRTIPLPAAMRDELKARYAALNGNVMRTWRPISARCSQRLRAARSTTRASTPGCGCRSRGVQG